MIRLFCKKAFKNLFGIKRLFYFLIVCSLNEVFIAIEKALLFLYD